MNFEPVLYCTSRSIPCEWTKEWLLKNGFPDVELISVGYGESKVESLKGKCDIFIDDRYDNFVELEKKNGMLLFNDSRKHNKRYNVGYRRIDDIKEFLK